MCSDIWGIFVVNGQTQYQENSFKSSWPLIFGPYPTQDPMRVSEGTDAIIRNQTYHSLTYYEEFRYSGIRNAVQWEARSNGSTHVREGNHADGLPDS